MRDVAAPRHVFLLTVDTLRADHLGSYGNVLGLTPNLDRLAGRAERFTRAYATAPFTLPSIASLLSGRYPQELGLIGNIGTLPPAVPLVAQLLKQKGFVCGAVVSSFVLRSYTGLKAGFTLYDERFPQREQTRRSPERIAESTTDAAIETLDRLLAYGADHVFLWVHYQDPHGPYSPPAGLRERYLPEERARQGEGARLPLSPTGIGGIPHYQYMANHRDAGFYRAGYDGEVRYMDGEVGRLLDAIAQRGLKDEGVIIFTADHGEGLGEGGYWFAHGEYLSDPSVRVPLLISTPGRAPRERDDLVSLVDLVPTLIGLFDLDHRDVTPGRDLFADTDLELDRSVYFMTTRHAATRKRAGLVMGQYKYVRSETPRGTREELYRLPDEVHDLAARNPALIRDMRETLDGRQREMRPPRSAGKPALPPSDLEALRALGYLEE